MNLALFLPLVLLQAEIRPAEPLWLRADPEIIARFFQSQYRALEAARPAPPASPEQASRRIAEVRKRHASALGVELEHRPRPVSWRAVGSVEREGYLLRRIVFESRPGLPVPALLYLPRGQGGGPAGTGRAPAVLAVHGHWQDAKAAQQVQLRNIFLARLGYVVLALDAIGAGERAYRDPEKGPITYHGRQLGYAVLPSGLTLAGLQVEDNRRALDLLASLPEVDPERIGVTGASGGGNQTFHLAILDERVRAAAAVCFFGAYRGYLEGAHCACELVPGVLGYAEEGDLAGCVAPRPLLVIAAVRDGGAAFRIEDARRSAEVARKWYQARGAPEAFRLREFDCDHDYNRDMREVMAAFFERHLRGRDRGERVEQPSIEAEAKESLAVFGRDGPGGEPGGALTVPQLAARRGGELATEASTTPDDLRRNLREVLRLRLSQSPPPVEPRGEGLGPAGLHLKSEVIFPEPEAAVGLVSLTRSPATRPARAVLLIAGGGERYRAVNRLDLPPDVLLAEVFPRGTGPTAWPQAAAVNCADYLLAQGSGALGRPILGMWVSDVLAAAERLRSRHPGIPIGVYGEGVMGTAAILAAAFDEGLQGAAAVDILSSWLWPARFDDRWPLGLFPPGILRAGDLPSFAAAIPPRILILSTPRDGSGKPLAGGDVERLSREIDARPHPATRLSASEDPGEVLERLLSGLAAH
jgi:dienelactone hydrolase